jgi:pimeloyl-ACP methyl ester carboxylesterase
VFRRIGLLAVLAACLLAPSALGATTQKGRPTEPISLASALNATCTAPQGNQLWLLTGCTSGNGTSFVAESMPAPGRFEVRGITFLWPGQSDYYFPPGSSGTLRLDSVVNPEAPIDLGGRAGYRYVALLVAGFGDQFGVPYTLTYADGTQSRARLWVRDWAAPQSESDIPNVRVQQGYDKVDLARGQGAIKVLLVKADPRKRLRSITLAPSTLTYAVSLTNQVPPGGGPVDGPRYSHARTEARYAAPGPWAVTRSRTSEACDSEGNACTVYSPAPLGRDPLTGKPVRHPVVVWANGTGIATTTYEYFLRHLASWGFLVISSDDTQTADGTTAVDVAAYVLDQAKRSRSPWRTAVDTTRIGLAGHSQGGGTTMTLFAHQTPPFSAYVAIHPAPSYFCTAVCGYQPGDLAGAKKGAILYLQSEGDGGAGDTENYYNQTPDSASKAFGSVAHAKHDDIMGNPHCTDSNCVTGSYGYLGYSTAWFVWQLGGRAELRQVFRSDVGEFVQPDPDWKLTRSNVR